MYYALCDHIGEKSEGRHAGQLRSPFPTSTEEIQLLYWTLQPILVSLRFFGIDVRWKDERTTSYYYLIRLAKLFWLLLNVSVVSYLAFYQYGIEMCHLSKLHKYFYFIPLINDHMMSAGVYAALQLATWQHGRDLVQAFQLIEANFEISKKHCVRIRYLSAVAIVLFIIAVKFLQISLRFENDFIKYLVFKIIGNDRDAIIQSRP